MIFKVKVRLNTKVIKTYHSLHLHQLCKVRDSQYTKATKNQIPEYFLYNEGIQNRQVLHDPQMYTA